MGHLSWLETHKHRNLEDARWDFSAKHIFFIGNNGQGKTNLLEAIYCLLRGKSFRTAHMQHLCQHGTRDMWVRGLYVHEHPEHIVYSYQNGTRRIEINNTPIRAQATLFTRYPCIPFVADDIRMVNGSPEEKRKYLNQNVLIADPGMVDTFSRFQTLLKQRNAALKQAQTMLLPALNGEFVRAGLQIQERRKEMIDTYAETLTRLTRKLSGDEFSVRLSYVPSWRCNDFDTIMAQLERDMQKELRLQTSQTGPHRDSYALDLDGVSVNSCASMGQLRIVALVLRIIQAQVYKDVYRYDPMYLFDDVLLEIDEEKKQRFVANLPQYTQAFFTFLPSESLSLFRADSCTEYHLREGRAQ